MKFITAILLSIFMISTSKESFSQSVGCQRGTSVYHQQGLLGVWGGTPYSTSCAPGSTTATLYAGNVTPLPGPQGCNINVLGGGILVNYNLLNCSLDKYILLLLIPCSLLSISILRNRDQ